MMIEIVSLISPPTRVRIDPYGLNPIAADYLAVNAATYNVAVAKAGPPPKMFFGGTANLPPFTASGTDPQALLKLPYRCRHYPSTPQLRVTSTIDSRHWLMASLDRLIRSS